MSDRSGDDNEEEADQRKDLQMRREAMDRAMAMDVETFTCIMAMVVLLVRVLLDLDWKVDLTFPSLPGT